MVGEWNDGVFGRWCTDAFHVVDLGFGFEVDGEGQNDGVHATVQRLGHAYTVHARRGVGMVDHRARGGKSIAKVPGDEPASVSGREEKIVEDVFNDHFFVVITLINPDQNEEVGAHRVVHGNNERGFFWDRKPRPSP